MSRRAHERLPITSRVTVSCTGDRAQYDAWLKDISVGGLFVKTEESFEVRAPILVVLENQSGDSMALEGEVVHVVSAEQACSTGIPAGVGVQFTDMPPLQMTMLEKFLALDAAESATSQTPLPAPAAVPAPVSDDAPALSTPPQVAPKADPAGAETRLSVSLPPARITNPQTPDALLRLRLFPPPNPRQTPRPCLIELIYGLGLARACGTLIAGGAAAREEIPFHKGALLLDDDAYKRVRDLAQQPELQVEMRPEVPKHTATQRPRDPRFMAVRMLRQILCRYRAEDLELGFGATLQRFPLRCRDAEPVKRGLQLDEREKRFYLLIIDGTRDIATLPQVSGMMKTSTYRLLCLLIVLGLVELEENPTYDASKDAALLFANECRQVLKENAFARLRFHWTEHPSQLEARYRKRLQRFQKDSPLARCHPELAKQVCDALDQAYAQLKDPTARVALRQSLGPDLAAAAEILVGHADSAEMRSDLQRAREFLEIAIELSPYPEYKQKLANLDRD